MVTHGQSSDSYWGVVKKGVDDATKLMGVHVSYQAPQTTDMVAMSRMIDAAVTQKVNGLVVSIPDPTALGKSIKAAVAAGIPVIIIDSGEDQVEAMGAKLFVGTQNYFAQGEAAAKTPVGAGRDRRRLRQCRAGQSGERIRLRRLQEGNGTAMATASTSPWIRPTPARASWPMSRRIRR